MHLHRLLYNSQLLQETDFLKNFNGRNVSTHTVCSLGCRACPSTLRVVELWQARHGGVLTGLLCSEVRAQSMKQNRRGCRNWAGWTYGDCSLPTITHRLKAVLPVHNWVWSKKITWKTNNPHPKPSAFQIFAFLVVCWFSSANIVVFEL